MKIACPTCLESFTSRCEISSTPCGHVFHTICIKGWFGTSNRNNSCPQCRTSCTVRQINKLYFPEALVENEFDTETNLKCIELKEENLKMTRELYVLKSPEANVKEQFNDQLKEKK